MKKTTVRSNNHEQAIWNFMGKNVFAGLFIGVILFGSITAWAFPAVRKAILLATTRQPEPFTELYFADHIKLPRNIIPNHPYVFGFTIHNQETQDMKYPYAVYARVGTITLPIDQGTVFIKKDAYKTIQERFSTTSAFPKSAIVVELRNKQQKIDFWIQGGAK